MHRKASDHMSDMPLELSEEIVKEIRLYLQKHDELFGNGSPEDIKERVFQTLKEHCIVMFYPIEDIEEKNDAFLFSGIPLKNGEKKEVVLINTFQTEEKQLFAAAHELGHVMGVDKYILERFNSIEDKELIVNRFAAELLMPQKSFVKHFYNQLSRLRVEKVKKEYGMMDFFEVIVGLMDYYSVPYNAVVIRLVETRIIDRNTGTFLVDGDEKIKKEEIKNAVKKIISEDQFTNLNNRSLKRDFSGLPEILSMVDSKEDIYRTKIQRLREAFQLPKGEVEKLEKIEIAINDIDERNLA